MSTVKATSRMKAGLYHGFVGFIYAYIKTTLAVHHALNGRLSHFSHTPLYFMFLTLACDIATDGDRLSGFPTQSIDFRPGHKMVLELLAVGVVGIYGL